MITGVKYYKIFCLAFAIGLTVFASKDLLLEVGHFVSHAHGYILNGTPIHSHQFHADQEGHRHQILDKIENTSETLKQNKGTTPPTSKEKVTVDQIKLICNSQIKGNINRSNYGQEIPYQLVKSQVYVFSTSPPPKFSAL